MGFEPMTSCSQNRHATSYAIFRKNNFKKEKVGFEPTMGIPIDLQSTAFNHSAISPIYKH